MITSQKSNQNALPGPEDITRVVLPNGITVLTRPNFNSPSVIVGGYLMTGSLNDPDEQLGLSHYTALALMRGTKNRSFQQIYDTLESVGASFGISGGTHTTGFTGRSLVEDLPMVLKVLSDILREPDFPLEQIKRLRSQLLTGLAIRAQDTRDMASMTFDQLIYPGHPYGRPDDGFTETIQNIQRDDLSQFHRQYYGPRGMVIVVVGAIEPTQAIDLVSNILGDWQNPIQKDTSPLPVVSPLAAPVRKAISIPGKSQADLVMGVLGLNRNSPDFIAASLGNNILGQFGMMGRIGDVVREQSGLAYYAYTNLNAGIGPGTWEVSAGVNPVNIEKTIDLVSKEIQRFISEPVLPNELSDSQANYIGRLPLSLESNGGVASALLNLERFNLGLGYYHQYENMIYQVNPEMVLDVARKYWSPDKMAIAVAGPGL